MRLVVAFFLCLSISLQGWAAAAGVQAPCPMGEMMAMQDSIVDFHVNLTPLD